MRTCLVLEGGALRGIYTAGVLDEMLKDNLDIDTIIGVSMGSLVGVNYLSKQPGRALRYNLNYCHDKRYMGFRSFIKTGNIINKDFAYYELPEKIDIFDYEEFKKSKIKFLCTVTNLDTGKAEYIEIKDCKKDIEYLRAGSSMPGLSKIVTINNKKYLDGGAYDSIPIEEALKRKFDRIIVVLTRPIEYRKKNKKLKLLSFIYRKYPNFSKSILMRNIKYNETVEEIIKLEKENKIFVIRPSREVKIKRIEKNKDIIIEQYNLGKKDYLDRKKNLFKYLKK